MKRKGDHAGGPGARELSRRDFLRRGSLGTLAGVLGASEVGARPAGTSGAPAAPRRDDPPVNLGVIGFGQWGREIAATLGRMPEAKLVAVSDSYDVMLTRARRSVPGVATHADYRQLLADQNIKAVVIATPTHLHREVALAALDAGKHVYLEAPMAASIEDARAIAQAAMKASKQIFQVGLPYRSNPQHRSVFQFIRSGAIGKPVMMRSQWNSKQSWRRTSADRDREAEQNWRLDPKVSPGLIGEIGIHQLDAATWFTQSLPVAVTGFGQIMHWRDGREVPDTIQAVFEFPSGAHLIYHASLATSFDAQYDMYHGSDSTIMLRDSKAWMFKEVDAPVLGWEVYARKDKFYRESGIALVANATKLDAQGVDPAADDPNVETPLFYALKEFVENNALGPYPPAAGYQQGFESAVIALKANEAVTGNKKITFEEEWYRLG